jgi:hypothetical protein
MLIHFSYETKPQFIHFLLGREKKKITLLSFPRASEIGSAPFVYGWKNAEFQPKIICKPDPPLLLRVSISSFQADLHSIHLWRVWWLLGELAALANIPAWEIYEGLLAFIPLLTTPLLGSMLSCMAISDWTSRSWGLFTTYSYQK